MAKDNTKDSKFIGGIVLSFIAGILLIGFSLIIYFSPTGFILPNLGQIVLSILFGLLIVFGSIVSYKMNATIGSLIILAFSFLDFLISNNILFGGDLVGGVLISSLLGLLGGVLIFLRRKSHGL